MTTAQIDARNQRIIARAKARLANNPKMSLVRFRKQVKALFPTPDFRVTADFIGLIARSADVTVEYNANTPDAAQYEVHIGRLTPTYGATLEDAVRNARAALATTLDAARRLEMDR